MLSRLVIGLLAGVFLAGCNQSNQLYYWGQYESVLYDHYVSGDADIGSQLIQLNLDVKKARDLDQKIAPGIYAHLGYLYSMQGKLEQSRQAFAQEKALFPESAVFIDGMLKRAGAH